MAAIPLIYLDTTIFIHAFEPSPQFDRAISNELIMFMSRNGGSKTPVFRTSQFTFGELWVQPYKHKKHELIELYENLSFSNKFLEVGPVSLDVIKGAAILRSEHTALKMPDALHISTAILFGCSHFLTTDNRLKGTFEIASNRYGFQTQLKPVSVLPPELKTLERLTSEFAAND